MRLVIQRVTSSSVAVKGEEIGKIGEGLLILVGVGERDTKEDAAALARKVSRMRILSDKAGKMNLSLIDKNQRALAISQFTLFADTRKGNRPSFTKAAKPEKAEALYKRFVESLQQEGVEVETGEFGGYMDIKTNLDGPVTIILDSDEQLRVDNPRY